MRLIDAESNTVEIVKGGGQLLICTAGEGWYQEEGKEAFEK